MIAIYAKFLGGGIPWPLLMYAGRNSCAGAVEVYSMPESCSEQCPYCGNEHASVALATQPGTVVCLDCGRQWAPSVAEHRRRQQAAGERLEWERKKIDKQGT